tara:strand:- start:836 stop:1531 length:696 start_codon:yes stop_codon:yes gene_type:complete
MKKYIQENAIKVLNNRNEFSLLDGQIPIFILNKLPIKVDLKKVIDTLEKNVPKNIIKMIEGIYIGEFEELKNRNIQAMFKDGVIYLSSFKEVPGVSEKLIVGDICHELAHAVEDNLGQEIYSDGTIETEYNGKKEKLYWLLTHEGYHFPKELLFNEKRIEELDDFLYHDVGYEKLSLIIPGLFVSPYSITSIREYFANGIEDYLLGDSEYLKQISPKLYNRINKLVDELDY